MSGEVKWDDIRPGQKVILVDRRTFGGNAMQMSVWKIALKEALKKLEFGEEWAVREATLPCGDTAVVVGPDLIIAIAEEKWTQEDLRQSKMDGRLFGEENELLRISEAGAKDGQFVFAYRDDPQEYGVIQSLCRDYRPITYQITSMKHYAEFLARFAARWDHKPGRRSSLRSKKVSLEVRQHNFLAYAFTDAIAEQLLERFGTPEDALAPLKTVTFTPKGNPRMPKEYQGIDTLGKGRLLTAHKIYLERGDCNVPAGEQQETIQEIS